MHNFSDKTSNDKIKEQTRMAPKTSPIWKYFDDDPDNYTNAVCKVPNCSKPTVSRGPDNSSKSNLAVSVLNNHLKNNHPQEYKDHLLDVKAKEDDKKRKTDEDAETNEMENHSLADKKFKSDSQSTLSGWIQGVNSKQGSSGCIYKINDPRAKERHRGIVAMMVLDLQPFSFVGDLGFKTFCGSMDKNFKPAGRKYYTDVIVKVYDQGVKKLQEKISKDNPEEVACQLDGWSVNHHGHMGLMISYITPQWKRVMMNLACSKFDDRHTGENISLFIEEKLELWNVLEKCNTITSDSASNMNKMMEFLPDRMARIPCLNHVLNLVIKDEILEKPEIEKIVLFCRRIIGFGNSSNNFYEEMRVVANELDKNELVLKQDVATRWNSTNDMLERLVDCEEVVKKVLDEKGWAEVIAKKSNTDKKKIHEKDWKIMKNVTKTLSPFKSATEQLSSNAACISECIPVVSMLQKTLESCGDSDQGVKDLKKRLGSNLQRRTDYMEDTEIYTIATLLDNRYKNCYFQDPAKRMKAEDRLKELLEHEILLLPVKEDTVVVASSSGENNNNTNTLAAMFAQVKQNVNSNPRRETSENVDKVLKDYFDSKLEDNNLLTWKKYEENSKDIPAKVALCKLAKRMLTAPPSSTATERLFSAAGNIADGRARLLPENLDRLLFLRENTLMQNISLDW